MEIANKVFLITGGGSGLGAATARLLASHGGQIVVVDVNGEAGQEVADSVSGAFVRADVSSEPDIENAVQSARHAFGGLHGVVNCAGIGSAARVIGKQGPFPLDVFQRVIQVNLIGSFNVIRLAAGVMAQMEPNDDGERGVMISTASVAAFEGQIGQAAYSASKGGIVSMTLPIARELAAYGIRVATIAPGIFDTPLLGQLPDAARSALGQQVPFPQRLGRPAEYALLVKQVIENPMINGETIRLDGAIRMSTR
ncbi:3-hydroxyacyl-CoA dehydrogenase [Alicyclobacillus curvatus]|nr:3-hydroxyacyl-CoA dehydrogenase [Alicyclobacillus curvatus]